MKSLTAVLLLEVSILTSCHSKPTEVTESRVAAPSASETFKLRSDCAKLGESIVKHEHDDLDITIGVRNYAWWHSIDGVSHYNSATNRCYVKLTIRTTSRTDELYDAYSVNLYDGQTNELLANTSKQISSGKLPKEVPSGTIFVSAMPGADAPDNYESVSDFIDRTMADDRTK